MASLASLAIVAFSRFTSVIYKLLRASYVGQFTASVTSKNRARQKKQQQQNTKRDFEAEHQERKRTSKVFREPRLSSLNSTFETPVNL